MPGDVPDNEQVPEPNCLICFNDAVYDCSNPDPFSCMNDAVFDVDLPTLVNLPLKANLPYLNFLETLADGFTIKDLVLRMDADASDITLTTISIDYSVGSSPGPFASPPFVIVAPGG